MELEIATIIMSEKHCTPLKRFVEVDDTQHSGNLGTVGAKNIRLQLIDQEMTSFDVGRSINAIVAPLSWQLEALIQSKRKLTEKKVQSFD